MLALNGIDQLAHCIDSFLIHAGGIRSAYNRLRVIVEHFSLRVKCEPEVRLDCGSHVKFSHVDLRCRGETFNCREIVCEVGLYNHYSCHKFQVEKLVRLGHVFRSFLSLCPIVIIVLSLRIVIVFFMT